jgi:hypothetical protein
MTADSVHCSTMVALLLNLMRTLRSALHTRAELALENLALRQQLANLAANEDIRKLLVRNCATTEIPMEFVLEEVVLAARDSGRKTSCGWRLRGLSAHCPSRAPVPGALLRRSQRRSRQVSAH